MDELIKSECSAFDVDLHILQHLLDSIPSNFMDIGFDRAAIPSEKQSDTKHLSMASF